MHIKELYFPFSHFSTILAWDRRELHLHIYTYTRAFKYTHRQKHTQKHTQSHVALSTPRNMHKVGFDFCSNASFQAKHQISTQSFKIRIILTVEFEIFL